MIERTYKIPSDTKPGEALFIAYHGLLWWKTADQSDAGQTVAITDPNNGERPTAPLQWELCQIIYPEPEDQDATL